MTTIRVARRRRHTTVDRRAINDERLSFRARGVLVWLLDKPDNWRTDSVALARAGKEGREAVRSALRELEEHGYLVRSRTRDERGRWVTVVEVHEVPPTEAQEPVSGEGSPAPRNPAPGKPAAGGLGAIPLPGLRQSTETENDPGADAPAEAKLVRGRAIATEVWDARKIAGKPVPAQPFVAVAKIGEALLDAGHAPAAIVSAMNAVPTISTRWVEAELARRAGLTGQRTGPRARVEGPRSPVPTGGAVPLEEL